MKRYTIQFAYLSVILMLVSCDTDNFFASDGVDSSYSESGTAGSMARFAIKGDKLYVVTSTELKTFDISNPSEMTEGGSMSLDWGVETIFPYNNYLFIGTMTGMHIIDVSNTDAIKYVGTYEHIVSCDPVVVYEKYAYITLHSESNWCGNNSNELHVVDIDKIFDEDFSYVSPETVLQMTNPLGLGVTEKYLFVCDEVLKVYDRSNPVSPVFLTSFDAVSNPYDVIPLDDLLIVVAEDGLYQFQFTDESITFLSHLPVNL